VAVECAVDSVAAVVADARIVGLDFVGYVETVDVHEEVFDAQIGIGQVMHADLHLKIVGLDADRRHGVRSRAEGVDFVVSRFPPLRVCPVVEVVLHHLQRIK